MDINSMLDLEKRTGISNKELAKFEQKADEVSRLIKGLADGTIAPSDVKVPGEKTEEEIRKEAEAKQQRIKEAEERRLKRKKEEIEKWWERAELLKGYNRKTAFAKHGELLRAISKQSREKRSNQDVEKVTEIKDDDGNVIFPRPKRTDVDRLDYSVWDSWIPDDPVSLEQMKEMKDKKDEDDNQKFEQANPEFCQNFRDDMEQREKSQLSKQKKVEKLKEKGNKYFKKKMYKDAIIVYKQALDIIPHHCALMTNMSQAFLLQKEYEDAKEYSERAIFLEPSNVKALWRRARIFSDQGKYEEAVSDLEWAVGCDPENDDLMKQLAVAREALDDHRILGKVQNRLENNKKKKKESGKIETNQSDVSIEERMRDILTNPPEAIEVLEQAIAKLKKLNEHGFEWDKDQVQHLQLTMTTLPSMLEECGKEGHTLFRTVGGLDIIKTWVFKVFDQESGVKIPYDKFRCDILENVLKLCEQKKNLLQLDGKTDSLFSLCMNLLSAKHDTTKSDEIKLILRLLEYAFGFEEIRESKFLSCKETKQRDKFLNSLLESYVQDFPTLICGILLELTHDKKCRVETIKILTKEKLNNNLIQISKGKDKAAAELSAGTLANLCQNVEYQNHVRQSRTQFTTSMLNIVLKAKLTAGSRCVLESYALAALLNASLGTENSAEYSNDIAQSGVVQHLFNLIGKFMGITYAPSKSKIGEAEYNYMSRIAAFTSRTLNDPKCLEQATKRDVLKTNLDSLVSSLLCFYQASNKGSSNAERILPYLVRIVALFLRIKHVFEAKVTSEKLIPILTSILEMLSNKKGALKSKDVMTMTANSIQCFVALTDSNEISNSKLFRSRVIPCIIDIFRYANDGPVRKNAAIVLAKLAKASPENLQIVRDLRGMEMLVECGNKYC